MRLGFAALSVGGLLLAGCGRPITAREARAQTNPQPPKRIAPSPGRQSSALAERAIRAAALPEPRRQVVEVALAMTGAPAKGLDCSSFAKQVYATTGHALPRTVRQQLAAGEPIRSTELRAGDLVFFAFEDRPADHVGIYTGDDSFVHVSTSARRVRIESLTKSVFASAYVGSRRFLGANH